MGGGCRKRRDEISLSRRGVAIGQVNSHVGTVGIAQRRLGDPCKKVGSGFVAVGGSEHGRVGGRRWLLLDEGDEAGNVVFGGGSGMNVDLDPLSALKGSGNGGHGMATLLLEYSSFTPLPDRAWAMVLYSSSSSSLTS